VERYSMYIDGKSVDPESGKWLDTYNPYTGAPWAQIAQGTADDVDRAVRAAHKAFRSGLWSTLKCKSAWSAAAQIGRPGRARREETGRDRGP